LYKLNGMEQHTTCKEHPLGNPIFLSTKNYNTMARVKNFMQMTGSLAMVSMYTLQGHDEVIIRTKGGPSKRQIKTKPQFAVVRQNNSEWAGCTKMGSQIRSAFYLLNRLEDYPVTGAINAICKHIQKTDTESVQGKRGILFSRNKETMVGFNFSKKQVFESMLRVSVNSSLNRETGVAQIDIPTINADMNLYNFRKLPFFRILGILGGVCDKTYSETGKEYVSLHEVNYRVAASEFESEWLPAAGNLPAMSFALTYPIDGTAIPESVSLILGIGLEFGKMGFDGKPEGVKYAGAGKVLRVV